MEDQLMSGNTGGEPIDLSGLENLNAASTDPANLPLTAQTGGQQEAELNLDALQTQADISEQNLAELDPLLAAQADKEATATDRSEDLFTRLNDFLTTQGEQLGTAGEITPEQKAAIASRTEELIGSGSADIQKNLQTSLESLREEAGASRGLRFTDTPIFDVAQDVTSSANTDVQRLISQARGEQATAELNLPFQTAQLNLAQAGQFGSFLGGAQSFQDQLAQQAFNNRAQLFGTASNLSTPGGVGFGEQLLADKGVSGNLAAIKAGKPSTGDKLFQAAIGLGGAALISDENLKHDITKFDEETILEKVADLDVGTWRYNEDTGLSTGKHIGPMAQEFQRVFGVGDGKSIALVDAIGVMLATQKALAKEALRG